MIKRTFALISYSFNLPFCKLQLVWNTNYTNVKFCLQVTIISSQFSNKLFEVQLVHKISYSLQWKNIVKLNCFEFSYYKSNIQFKKFLWKWTSENFFLKTASSSFHIPKVNLVHINIDFLVENPFYIETEERIMERKIQKIQHEKFL